MKSLDSLNSPSKSQMPEHIAIIMDGNGRWAQRRNLDRSFGHKCGAKVTENIVSHCYDRNIKYVTLYAFSSENWRRPKTEINAVMEILQRYLKEDVEAILEKGVKINAIGDLKTLPESLQRSLNLLMEKSKHAKKMVLTLALSYGSMNEIIQLTKTLAQKVQAQELNIEDINEETIDTNLFTKNIPNPDLLIRTGGEIRLSNYLLLQLRYAEFYFTDILWPDFQKRHLDQALRAFKQRQRRFGKSS